MLAIKTPRMVSTKKQWTRPIVNNSRLGFEVTAYSGSKVAFEQVEWVRPVVIETRLGFEVTAYSGKENK